LRACPEDLLRAPKPCGKRVSKYEPLECLISGHSHGRHNPSLRQNMHAEANNNAKGAADAGASSPRRRPRRRSRRRRVLLLPATGAAIAFAVRAAMTALSSTSRRSPTPSRGDKSPRSSSGFATLFADAIRANPNPIFDQRDDGGATDGRPIYIRGDERLHWYEDKDGYTLIDDGEYDEREEEGRSATTATRGAILANRTSCGTAEHCTTSRRWVYAEEDPITGGLISTGVRFGSPSYRDLIRRMGLKKHVRPNIANDDGHLRSPRILRGRRRAVGRQLSSSGMNSTPNSMRNLVLLMRFSDHANRTLPSPSDYDVLMNGPGGKGTVAPTGSVRDVFASNSYRTFVLESTVYPWITLSGNESYYAEGKSGLGNRIFEGIREALDAIQSDPSFDLSHFNADRNDGDEYIDAITIIHSGYGAEFGGTDCRGAREKDRIWSHKYFMHTGAWRSADGKVTVRDYNINPGLWGVCGTEISRIGVIAHEAAHFLGLPDLYDPEGGEGIGSYCLMADSWGVDGSQRYPPMMSPWSKIQLGWLAPTTLEVRGDYPLRRSWEYPDAYKIRLGSGSEYLLMENRQPGSYDVLLPLGGLAIWHVDDDMSQYANSREGYPGQLGWPENGKHYQVALLQADGKYDLERGRNQGDYSDLFRYDHYVGVDQLSPSNSSDPKIGPFPNTDSYRQGSLGRTNHFITGVSGKEESRVHRMHQLFIRAKVI
jgi:M6 family metalloprotease-like protein